MRTFLQYYLIYVSIFDTIWANILNRGALMSNAQETRLMLAALKRCLKMKGITYRDLAPRMNLSESSVKRLFAGGNFSMRRFEQVCRLLGMSMFDVSKMAMEKSGAPDPRTLSDEQERELARSPELLIGFHLVQNGWEFGQIVDAFSWSESELIRICARLDRLGLIELLPGNRFKSLIAGGIRWRKDGAVRARYQKQVFAEFLDDGFDADGQFLEFEILELSPASVTLLTRKLELLLREVGELAAVDNSLHPRDKLSTGLLLALRPWVYSRAIDAMSEAYKKTRKV